MERKVINIWNVSLVCFIYFLVYGTLGGLISKFYGGFSSEHIVFLQFLLDFLILILILLASSKILVHSIKSTNNRKIIPEGIKYFLLMLLMNFILSMPYALFFENESSNNEIKLMQATLEFPMYMFFLSVIFAPIVEELVFRGFIYKYIRQIFNKNTAIILSSGSFAILHFMTSILSKDYLDLYFVPLYLVPGIILCLAYEKTKNIFTPIFIHTLNNLLSFALAMLIKT